MTSEEVLLVTLPSAIENRLMSPFRAACFFWHKYMAHIVFHWVSDPGFHYPQKSQGAPNSDCLEAAWRLY